MSGVGVLFALQHPANHFGVDGPLPVALPGIARVDGDVSRPVPTASSAVDANEADEATRKPSKIRSV